jgi:hypothetical protein
LQKKVLYLAYGKEKRGRNQMEIRCNGSIKKEAK